MLFRSRDAPWFSWFWCGIICLIALTIIYAVFFFYYRKKRLEQIGPAIRLQALVNAEAAKELVTDSEETPASEGVKVEEHSKDERRN